MTSLLEPSYAITLGDQRWTEQALALDVRLRAAPVVDVASVRLPAAAPVRCATGDPVVVELDGGEGGETVFTGTVRAIRRTPAATIVTALNGGGLLAAYRPAATYEQVTAGTVIRTLCDDAGVQAGDVDDGVALAFYVADPARTALDHVARLAAWGGALARVSADDRLDATVVNAVQADVALRYGRELLDLEQVEAASSIDAFVVAGEAGAGSTSAPQALRATTDFFGGSRPDGPSVTSSWRFEPALRTSAAARSAGAALDRGYRAGRRRGLLTAILRPAVRPCTVLELRDLPDGLEQGPFWAGDVHHHVSLDGATTRARLWRGGDTFDPTAQLAGALSGLI